MHQIKKGNQWYHRYAEGCAYGMEVHAGVDKGSGLIHSVLVAAANVNDLTPVAELLHGDEEVAYGDAGYLGIAKRPLNSRQDNRSQSGDATRQTKCPAGNARGKAARSDRNGQGPPQSAASSTCWQHYRICSTPESS
jgi:hypothetical protein